MRGVRGRRGPIVVLVCAALAPLTGCTGAHDGEAKPAATVAASVAAPAREAWRVPLAPTGRAVVGQGVVALFSVAPRGALTLTVLDAATGVFLWRAPATAGYFGNGDNLNPSIVWDEKRAYVTYLEPTAAAAGPDGEEDPGSVIVVADARTGRVKARSEDQFFVAHPTVCDDGIGVCAPVTGPGGSEVPFRFTVPGVGRLSGKSPTPVAFEAGTDAAGFTLGAGADAALSHRSAGKVDWTLPLTTVFGGEVLPTYLRVRQVRRDGEAIVVSSVRRLRDGRHDMGAVFTTAAVDRRGKVLWRAPGTLTACYGLAANLDGDVDGAAADGSRPKAVTSPQDPWVRCRYRSSAVTVKQGYPQLKSAPAPVVVMEGFDPATGKATWTWPIGRAPEMGLFRLATMPHTVAGPTSFVVKSAGVPHVVDLATGMHRPAAKDAVYLCVRRTAFSKLRPVWPGVAAGAVRDSGFLALACTLDEKPSTRLPSLATLAAYGATSGGTVVITVADAVVGYR